MSLDATVFGDIIENLKASAEKGDKPYFGFHVTCQGRGKYESNYRTWGTDTNPLFENADVSPEANNILNNYLGSLKDTSWRLNSFVSEIEKMKEPVVVLIFSDYKPWLGDNNSVYNELGVNLNEYSADGFLNRYATEYVIVANDAAKKALGKDLVGSGKPTSPCFLMSELFELMGLEGSAFMQYTDEVNEKILAMNHFGLIDDAITYYYPDVVPDDLREIRDEYKFVAYYDSKQTVE